jgi:hypothetical protein
MLLENTPNLKHFSKNRVFNLSYSSVTDCPMRSIFLSIAMLLSLAANAQTQNQLPFSLQVDITTKDFVVGGDVEVKGHIKNKTDSTLKIAFVRTQNIPCGWTTSVCFGAQCYAQTKDDNLDEPSEFPAGEEREFVFHIASRECQAGESNTMVKVIAMSGNSADTQTLYIRGLGTFSDTCAHGVGCKVLAATGGSEEVEVETSSLPSTMYEVDIYNTLTQDIRIQSVHIEGPDADKITIDPASLTELLESTIEAENGYSPSSGEAFKLYTTGTGTRRFKVVVEPKLGVEAKPVAIADLRFSQNPAWGAVTINVSRAQSASLEVIDLLGNTVASSTGTEWSWQPAAALTGSYFVRATGKDENGQAFRLTERLIVR